MWQPAHSLRDARRSRSCSRLCGRSMLPRERWRLFHLPKKQLLMCTPNLPLSRLQWKIALPMRVHCESSTISTGEGKGETREATKQKPLEGEVNRVVLKRLARQTGAIQRWRQWQQSTGPRTEAVRKRSGRNAFRGGERERNREFARLLRRQRQYLQSLNR